MKWASKLSPDWDQEKISRLSASSWASKSTEEGGRYTRLTAGDEEKDCLGQQEINGTRTL